MKPVIKVSIAGQTMFANILGSTAFNGRQWFTVCGLVGRRSAMDYVLPYIHAGESIRLSDDKKVLYSMGARRYAGKKASLEDGVQYVMIMPNSVSVSDADDSAEEKDLSSIKTVIWNKHQDTQDRVWSAIVHKTPIPMRDAWEKPLLQALKNAQQLDDWRTESGISAKNHERITPVDFIVGGDDWGGVVLNVDDDDIALCTQHLLRTKEITL